MAGASWSIDDIPYGLLVRGQGRDLVRDDERLFYLLASASFIEITSDLYTGNLVEFYRCDAEIVDWLERYWQKEELQHGAALKRYVQTAWPEFDWEDAYRGFLAEYTKLCTVEQLAGTRALEMAARCVVETGTASFYRMLSEQTGEPVLKQLAANISSDEVRHYKHFYRYFRRYQVLEQPSRTAVLRTLWSRVAAIDAEDAFCAFKPLYLARHPGTPFRKSDYDAYRVYVRQLAKSHFPYDMATKMLLKPLGLNALVGRAAVPAARLLLLAQ
jgi:rubrerythrin